MHKSGIATSWTVLRRWRDSDRFEEGSSYCDCGTFCGVVKSTTGEVPLDTVNTGLLNNIRRVLKLARKMTGRRASIEVWDQ